MRKDKESGAIVVEATISLTAFIFVIFTILSIVNICYIQAKMSIALNSAAKEISQYSYLYYVMGADELDAKVSEGTEEESQLAKNTIDGVGTMLNSLSDSVRIMVTSNIFAQWLSNVPLMIGTIAGAVVVAGGGVVGAVTLRKRKRIKK